VDAQNRTTLTHNAAVLVSFDVMRQLQAWMRG
jgi:hypothetical protein